MIIKFSPVFWFLLSSFVIIANTNAQSNYDSKDNTLTVQERLSRNPDLSEFHSLVEKDRRALTELQSYKVTVFSPTNHAFQSHQKQPKEEDYLASYHFINRALLLRDLPSHAATLVDGNPPVWFTKKNLNNNKQEYYINNAKINTNRSDYMSFTGNNKEQVLHIIDEVLVPLRYNKSRGYMIADAAVYASVFLARASDFDIGNVGPLRIFASRVFEHQKEGIFSKDGSYTFFIPIDSGLEHVPSDKLDTKVIDSHVVPNNVLFTRATTIGAKFRTLAYYDNLKVTVSLSSEKTSNGYRYFVRSDTVTGDYDHPTGAVLAEIVRPNIPVLNGVVHLISKPLVIVNDTVVEFIKGDKDGLLSEFYKVLTNGGSDLLKKFSSSGPLTVFAPSNNALRQAYVQSVLHNRSVIREIIDMHIVPEELTISSIRKRNSRESVTLAPNKHLYFNLLVDEANYTLTVEGGGTNATVIHPDIRAKNGYIHIIDKVLGIPYSTIAWKLATDPELDLTNNISRGLRTTFNDIRHNYTFFAPRNFAWEFLNLQHPTLFKILFSSENEYQAKQVMERHLLIDKVLTMDELTKIAQSPISLPAARDTLNIKAKLDKKGYTIEWNNKLITVSRADVKCTNGIIHVIDSVLMKESDIKIAVSAANLPESALHFALFTGFYVINIIIAVNQ